MSGSGVVNRAVSAARQVDRELARIHAGQEFLLQASPVNSEEAWESFRGGGCREAPAFRYRPPPPELDSWEESLAELPLGEVEDPTVARLFREKRKELVIRTRMLRGRGGPRFLEHGVRLYGEVDPELLTLARTLLERMPPYEEPLGKRRKSQADEDDVARAARLELAAYRKAWPPFPTDVEIRDDLPPGLMVSGGRLLIGRGTTASWKRVEALIQHEVGTHMVTFYNGQAQPLEILRVGLARYETLQEGLAVVSEYLVGGLTISRLRVLAARVLAVHALLERVGFVDLFHLLHREHGFKPYHAFAIATRVHRGGGLPKDMIYLAGFAQVARHLRRGGELRPLFAGKFALDHLPYLEELKERGVLRPSPLGPRVLERPHVETQLERLRGGVALVEILERRIENERDPTARGRLAGPAGPDGRRAPESPERGSAPAGRPAPGSPERGSA